jgi:hypothetical protein
MASLPCHEDNPPSSSLLEEGGQPKGRNDHECISPFSNVSRPKSKSFLMSEADSCNKLHLAEKTRERKGVKSSVKERGRSL